MRQESGAPLKPLKIVGHSTPRIDALQRVTGKATYTGDVQLPGMLYARVLRSPHPHARIRRIDLSKVSALPGVKAIITGRDIPHCYIGKQIRDMPVLCWDLVRFIGDRVAAVAAETRDAAGNAFKRPPDARVEQLSGSFYLRCHRLAAQRNALVGSRTFGG